MPEGRIFISYRRGADEGITGRLHDGLERHFERDQLFMDVDAIPLGVDFVEHLDAQVAACHVFLAVIGRGWIERIEELRDEDDFVRIEIEAALRRPEIPIIPVLVDDTRMPRRDRLPESLQPLLRRAGLQVPHAHFAAVVGGRLTTALRSALERTMPDRPAGEDEMAREEPAEPARAERTLPPNAARVLGPVHDEMAGQQPEGYAEPSPEHMKPGSVFRDSTEPWAPEMVVIPAGSFMMGSTEEEAKTFAVPDKYAASERPRHRVEIARPFALARHALTFAEYDAFCEATGHDSPGDMGWGRGRRPVINVTWEDAAAWCGWASEKSGYEYRLPSEAEWEYACRAGTETVFSFGDVISTDLANYDGNYTASGSKKGEYREQTLPVDFPGFQPNAFGLWQMHGNVWEWCFDDFAESYESKRTQTPFTASPRHSRRVVRGGSWDDSPQILRSAIRSGAEPVFRISFLGFRPARTLLTP